MAFTPAAECSTSSVSRRCAAACSRRQTMCAGAGARARIAVISYGFWQRRLSAAPDAIGRRLTIDRVPVTIVGVAPRGFFGPDVGRIG